MSRLGTEIGAVWIATAPRTGSMWTTNVVREICRTEGFEPLPERRIAGERERLEYGARHVREANPGVAVLKLHSVVPALPRSAGIVTQRDVRDVFISYMRFMRQSFDEALPFVSAALKLPPEIRYPGENRYLVDYTLITQQPAEAIRGIADFLGAQQASLVADQIAAKFSKEKVRAKIDAADAEVRALAASGEKIRKDRLVILSPTNWRVLDQETGFQTGHVSDYVEGDWRKILTEEQQVRLNELVDAAGRSVV